MGDTNNTVTTNTETTGQTQAVTTNNSSETNIDSAIERGTEQKTNAILKSYFKQQGMEESEIQAAGVIDSLHALIAEILNNNLENPNPKKPKKPIKAEDLENYDIEECMAILNAYTDFMDELKTDPN